MARKGVNPKTGKRYEWEEAQAAKQQSENDQQAVEKHLSLLRRQQKAIEAREKLIAFTEFTMPDPDRSDDVRYSAYHAARHHHGVAAALEQVVEGEIPFLILTIPPRHGKSELVSRRLPAWLMGRYPHMSGIVATYNDDFAMDFGKDVRGIMRTRQFRQAFPGVALQRGGSAADRLQTTAGGQWSFVGRGGSLTGRGGHCFVSGTLVETKDGVRQIEALQPGQEVLSFDQGQICWRRVQAVARRPEARIFRIATAAGRVVEATGDHPFHVDGRWIEAAELAAGDRLLCAVRDVGDAAGLRRAEALGSWSRRLLLLERLLGTRGKPRKIRGAGVRAVWSRCSEGLVGRNAGRGPGVLLARVLGRRAAGRVRAASAVAHEALRTLQRYVSAGEQHEPLLLPRLLFAGARRPDGWPWQFALAGRCVGEPGKAACHATLSRIEAHGHGTGRPEVSSVRGNRGTGGPPHRREPAEQQGGQLGDRVSSMPREGAFFRREADVVATVEDTGRTAPVFDIQVEGSHCFFANEILAHNCLICDDLIKDDREAQSQAIRDQAWSWFTKVAMSRRMGKKSVVLTFTRWHADDPIGRLTDPENQHYNETLARRIKIINLPAIAEDDDPLGREVGEPLWPDGPDRFDLEFLNEQRALDPIGFEALYQQRPSLMDGDLFKREDIRYYGPGTGVELPDEFQVYCSSDHAVGLKQRNDPSVLLKGVVDRDGNLYLTDCYWRRAATDVIVEQMLNMGGKGSNRPVMWWAESGHISKSLGPFLRKRMLEDNAFFVVREITPVADKATRAQSIAGRVASGKVFFPAGSPWTERAINEMMAFPNGLHDDFVDALALFGLGLQSQFGPGKRQEARKPKEPAFGTLDWVKQQDKWAEKMRQAEMASGF